LPSSWWTLQQRKGEYLELLRMEKRSPGTLKNYNEVLTDSFEALMEAGLEFSPKRIGKREIDFLRQQHYKGSIHYNRWRLSIFGTFLKWSGNNIVEQMRIGWPQDMRIHANWLEPEEAIAVRNVAEGVERVIVHLELDLCMRRIEVLRLRPEDFKGDRISVLGKGVQGGKWRTVRYHPQTREIIGEWLLTRQKMVAQVRVLDPKAQIPDSLLIYKHGARLYAYQKTGIDQILGRLRKKTELVYGRAFDFSNHTLRRTGGRMLWKAKVPLEVIKEILGHEDTKQTIRYLGLNLDDQDEAMNRLAQYQNSLSFPKKEILEASQREWWAQRDLDS
jgi:integrase/recombinase XerD